ncbi:MAG TPA: hypothetical protein VM597_34245 [Gemmataceae bacterium]|jgi:hypothetical protein|nr:hypothetical protein [Gemmataceae bacterium]
MAVSITGSVGSYESGARNLPADIRTVQTLLTQAAKTLKVPAYDPNGVDGQIARPGSRSGTVKAIASFQRNYVGMSNPDQRIDVNGTTWKRLVAVGESGPPVPPTPVKGLITLTATHGGKIPTATKFKATPATAGGMYESTFTLSGGLSGTFRGSIYPDDMTVKGRVIDGTYPLHIGFHKGGSAAKQTAANLVVKTQDIRAGLLVNARNGVPVQSDNPSKTESFGINVHNGFNSARFSDGCLTLHPDDWARFIQLFLDAFPNIEDWHAVGTNTGKKVGSLVIKAS